MSPERYISESPFDQPDVPAEYDADLAGSSAGNGPGTKKAVRRQPGRPSDSAASLYVCAECLNVLDQDETACAMACPDHPGAVRLWIEVPVSREAIREVVEREYGVAP